MIISKRKTCSYCLAVAVIVIIIFIMLPSATPNAVLVSSEEDEPALELGRLNVFTENITLSGFSAGASMAIQTHMAHSSLFSGLAIFSQAFYLCGHGSLIEFGIRCSTRGFGLFPYSVSSSVDDATEYAKKGLIDPIRNLARQRIFIWTGDLDAYIPSDMAAKNEDFYREMGVHSENLRFTLFTNASHLIPTDHFGVACDEDADHTYYLGNCNYPGPYHALSYILNANLISNATPDRQQLKLYNQSVFYSQGNIRDVAMGTRGYIYIPKRCESAEQQCLLHLNFHGCNEWPPQVAQEYILNSGFLSVAEANGIIMIFPLTTKVPQNMNGCWDFFSYTGTNFATKKGAQIQVIERLLQRVLYGK